MKIRNKMILVFSATTFLLIGIAGFIFYEFSRNELKKLIYAHLELAICSRTEYIKTFLKMQKNSIAQLAEGIVIRNLLFTTKKENPHYGDELDLVMKRVKNTEKIFPDIYEIFLLNANGKIIASSAKSRIGLDKSGDAYFLGAKKSGKSYIKDAYYSKTTGQKAMAISAPIIDRKTGELLGVVVARIRMDGINKILGDRTGLGKTGETYIVNRDGLMITPSRFKKDTFLKLKIDTANTRKHFENIKKFGAGDYPYGPMLYKDYRGVKVLGVHKHIPELQWMLLAEIDEKEVFASLDKIKFLFTIILIFVPLLAILIADFISFFVFRPLRKLHQGMEIVGSGNVDYKVGTRAKDEIGQLSREFDRMTENLKKTTVSIGNLNQEVVERKRAEKKIRYISFHDTLTGLYNRNFFEEEMNRLNAQRQYPVSIIVADINGLKFVNDTFSHSQGDELLKSTSKILRSVSRKEDIVSRIGGDEFAIILPQSDENIARTFCDRVKNKCKKYSRQSIHRPKLSIALGCATQSGQYKSIDEALKKADKSMYAEKMRMKKISEK